MAGGTDIPAPALDDALHLDHYGGHRLPFVSVGGHGVRMRLADSDGTTFEVIDASGGYGSACLGAGHPVVRRALLRAVDELGYATDEVGALERTRLLQETLGPGGLWTDHFPPGEYHLSGRNSGSEGVELALRLVLESRLDRRTLRPAPARAGRDLILAFEGVWHGWTGALVPLLNRRHYRVGLPEPATAPPYGLSVEHLPFGSADALREFFAEHGHRLLAVVVEPVQGDAGIVPPPAGYLRELALVAQVLAGLVTGARLVIAGPPFSPHGHAETIRRYGVTSSSLTPFLVRHLPDSPWAPSLRMLTVGGDTLAAERVASLRAAQPDLELYLTYGLTEAGPRVSTLAAHREPPHRYASVGRPLPGVRVALRDVRDGAGELLVASDTFLVRRVGEAKEQPFTDPGRIATGDLFRIDADGYLYFGGRMGDSMVIDGFKVSLPSVRRLAAALPGVVNARTRVCAGGHGTHEEPRFSLDLYLRDPGAVRRVETELRRRLLRAELPCRIRAFPAQEMTHK
jgi:hypothetical protein